MFLGKQALIRFYWVALMAVLSLQRPVAAQELDLRPLPLPSQIDSLSLPPSDPVTQPQPEGKDTVKKSTPEGVQKGTSNDRILWTMPNFLTMENAGKLPPLTPAEKFKVTARGLFDPFEFVLIGVVAGFGQARNSNP